MTTTPPPDGATPSVPGPPPTPPSYPPAPLYPSGAAYPAAPAGAWAPAGPAPGLAYAGFGPRLLGYLIDSLLLLVAEAAVTIPLVIVPLVRFYRDHPVVRGQSLPPLPTDLTTRFTVLSVLGAAASALYFGGLVAWRGRTLGQQAVGATVVRAEDGGKLPAGRAFLRAIVFWGPGLLNALPLLGSVAGLIAFIAMLAVAWDPRKQGWHDKLGKDLVVRPLPQPTGYVR